MHLENSIAGSPIHAGRMDGIKTPSLLKIWSFSSFVQFPNIKMDCIKEMGKL